MIRSKSQDLGEYDLIRTPKHVARVWAEIEKSLPTYWSHLVQTERQHHTESLFAEKCGKELPAEATVVGPVFIKALADYEKEAEKYRHWFESETLAEFHDDPNAFKQMLSRDVPIIANTLRQRRDELKEWQMHFHDTKSKDLLEVFSNVIDFVDEWTNEHPSEEYADLDDPVAFGLDPLDDDKTMVISSVIGMGIKSIVLYHLDPSRFPARGQNALYGMYFLSGRSDFRLPSKTSEFLMIDDIHKKSGCKYLNLNICRGRSIVIKPFKY